MFLIDSYSEANQSSMELLRPTGFDSVGQSFHNKYGCNLIQANFFIRKVGSPPGNYRAALYAHTGTLGTGTVPGTPPTALAYSDEYAANDLTGTFTVNGLLFSTPFHLQGNTNYVICIEYTSGDVANRVEVGMDNTTPTHAGCESRNTNLPTNAFSAVTGNDICFYVYGERIGPFPTHLS